MLFRLERVGSGKPGGALGVEQLDSSVSEDRDQQIRPFDVLGFEAQSRLDEGLVQQPAASYARRGSDDRASQQTDVCKFRCSIGRSCDDYQMSRHDGWSWSFSLSSAWRGTNQQPLVGGLQEGTSPGPSQAQVFDRWGVQTRAAWAAQKHAKLNFVPTGHGQARIERYRRSVWPVVRNRPMRMKRRYSRSSTNRCRPR